MRKGRTTSLNRLILTAAGVALILSMTACYTTAQPEADLSRQVTLEKSLADQPDIKNNPKRTTAKPPTGIIPQGYKAPPLNVEIAIVGEVRERAFVDSALQEVADIYRQCQVPLNTSISELSGEEPFDVNVQQRYALTHKYLATRPTVFIIGTSAEQEVAFSYLPSLARDISGTAWISNRVSKSCFAWIVAHEIGHIIMDSSTHHPQPRNVMNAQCSANSNYNRSASQPNWTEAQCEVIRQHPLTTYP